ncbi:hypothetical protein TPA0909_46410 [Streptomyces albus]|nr:hypothetical protein TPA0909_46410 [Streptomyces albus]
MDDEIENVPRTTDVRFREPRRPAGPRWRTAPLKRGPTRGAEQRAAGARIGPARRDHRTRRTARQSATRGARLNTARRAQRDNRTRPAARPATGWTRPQGRVPPQVRASCRCQFLTGHSRGFL